MKQRREILQDAINLLLFLAGILLTFTLVALLDPASPLWLIHAAGISLTLGRILHGIGLHTGVLNFGRMFGMILTWVSYLLIGGGLIAAGLAQQL